MAITHVQLFSLPVSDPDRSLRFYCDVLGFTLVRDSPMGPGQRWVQVAPPGGQTSVTLVTWFPSMPPGSMKGIVLESGDLDGDVARLRSQGVALDGEIEEQPWGRFVTLADPDGNGIVLQATSTGGQT